MLSSQTQCRIIRAAIVVAAFAIYSNSANNRALHFDEEASIVRDQNWAAVVERDHMRGSRQWRPLATGALSLQGAAFGHDARGFRLTSAALHAANSFMLLEVLAAWGFASPVVAAAGVIFAVHPAATEPVNWLVAQSELLALLFVLIALYATAPKSEITGSVLPLAVSSGAVLCGLMAKEQAAGAAIVVLAAGHVIPWNSTGDRLRAYRAAALWTGMVVLYLVFRFLNQGAAVSAGLATVAANPLVQLPFWERWISAGHVFWHYLAKLVVPWPLVSLYGYPDFLPVPVASAQGLAGLMALFCIGLLPALAWKNPGPLWLAPAGILAFLLPVSNIPLAIGTIFGDRLLYSPSAFFAFGVAWVLFSLFPERITGEWLKAAVPLSLLALLVIPYAIITWNRNPDWSTACRRFTSDLSHHPDSVLVLANAAGCAAEDGDLDNATAFALRANQILPDFPEGLIIAAKIFSADGRIDEGAGYWQAAIAAKRKEMAWMKQEGRIDPVYFEYIQSMLDMQSPERAAEAVRLWTSDSRLTPREAVGAALSMQRSFSPGVIQFVLEKLPDNYGRSADSLSAVGEIWFESDDIDLARRGEAFLIEAIQMDPGQVSALALLGQYALIRGETDTAADYLSRCLDAQPDHHGCLVAMSQVWLKQGCRSKARELLKTLEGLGTLIPPDIRLKSQGADTGRCLRPDAGK